MPGSSPSDSARPQRTILMNQTLLTAAVLLGTVASVLLGEVQDASPFVLGSAIVFLGTAAAFLIPWHRIASWAAGLVPVSDLVAVGLLREGAPSSGLGVLWVFPAMWIGAMFGAAGVVAVTAAISAIMVAQVASVSNVDPTAASFVVPVTIAALAALAHQYTRRSQAQRALLEKQSAELRRSLDRARRQEHLVTEVLDAVDFGVIRIAADGELAVTNDAHARLQGSADTGVGARTFAADGVTPLSPERTPLARARSGEMFEGEVVWYGAPGAGRRALTVTARRMTDPDGEEAGSLVVSRDVTAEEQALRAREDLIASVSHELRTPLTSIMGYLELALEDPRLPDASRSQIEVAARNAARLRALIADILAMSVDSRHGIDFALALVPTDVAGVVRAAVESEQPRAAERHIGVDISRIRPAVASVDPHRLRQVVDNLLSNAIKYNAHGGTITVEVARQDHSVIVSIADDGPGIPAVEQGRLFERFYRADAVRNSSTHGSGLGLAISRDIVRAHGGDIEVRSEPGSGAMFTVRLPAPPEALE